MPNSCMTATSLLSHQTDTNFDLPAGQPELLQHMYIHSMACMLHRLTVSSGDHRFTC